MKVRVLNGQNIADVVLQHYGSLEGVSDFLSRNNFAFDTELVAGQEVDVSEMPINVDVVDFYNVNGSPSNQNGTNN